MQGSRPLVLIDLQVGGCKKLAAGDRSGAPPLDHIAIAVPALDDAIPLFARLTGVEATDRERVESQGVEVVFLGEGPGRLELIAPLGPDSPVARFIEIHGPGLHHLAYRVGDVGAALAELVKQGIRAVDEEPRPGAHGRRIAFLHPRSTGGVLVELVEG
jgi:methylmalonyl-CoA epimerase